MTTNGPLRRSLIVLVPGMLLQTEGSEGAMRCRQLLQFVKNRVNYRGEKNPEGADWLTNGSEGAMRCRRSLQF